MRIPHQDAKRLAFYEEIVDVCMASRPRRVEQYASWRNFFFYGTNGEENPSAWNLIYAHLDTVTSFLYASDSTRFSVTMGSHAPRADYKRTGAFAKRIMEEWKKSNADTIMQMAILWALVYDSTLVKHIRRKGGRVDPYVVDPACFGVYREDVPMLDRQEAFVHVYYMTESDLRKRLALHPKREDIIKYASASYTKKDTASATPPIVDRVILTSGVPGQGMESLVGEANVNIGQAADYTAQLSVPVIEMQEIYVWNDAEDDYQVCTMAGGNSIVYDRRNIFMPRSPEFEGEHGFVQVCPNPLPDYFWGQSEVSKLYTIQQKLNDRMADIERLEQKQVDPPTSWGGMGMPEDKLSGFNSPGASIAIGDPNYKKDSYIPVIPEHIYAALDRHQDQMNTVSGLTNVTQGKGESGVRSAGHAGKLLTVGTARPKKRAMIIEDALEKSAQLFGICLYVGETEELHDEADLPFIPAEMSPDFSVNVDAHSNSPIFMENQQVMSDRLLKARAITREKYILMNAPPMQDELIRDLKEKIEPAEKAAAAAKMQLEAAKTAGAPGLKSVK
jgi:hypothetical protein